MEGPGPRRRAGPRPISQRRRPRRSSQSPRVEPGGTPERRDLAARQHSKPAGLEATEAQGTKRRAPKRQRLVADRLQHAPHLAMPALSNHDSELRAPRVAIARGRPHDLDLRRRRHSIVELHAATQGIEVGARGHAGGHDLVLLGHLVAGMREAVRDIAVVREQEEAGAVGVEPSDWEQAMTRQSLRSDDVEHGRARRLVTRGRDHAERFVEHQVAMAGRRLDGAAVNRDVVAVRIDEHPGLRRALAVDADRTGGDEGIRGTAAGDARARKEPVQTLARAPSSPPSDFGVGRLSRDSRPITWRNRIVVPYSLGWPGPEPRPTSVIRSRSSRFASTLSQLTPRTSSMRARDTGCW